MNSSSSPQRSGGATNQPLIGARQVSNSSNRNEEENVTTMSRAERFEDEKRRIIESCFSKKDSDGSISESYITHIRIVEDAAFPSSPPPPQSPQENKKPRIIIVAVRKSGRVRMHKARENANGSFSIGKTWVLDDLTVIESFVGALPTNPEEEKRKDWAGSAGFLITIQKPYYWQARTPKEKDFFIGSLIKIFKKYTGGKLPQLYGFAPGEIEQFAGVPNHQAKTPKTALFSAQLSSAPPFSPEPSSTPQNSAKPESSRELRSQPSADDSLRSSSDPQVSEVPNSSSYPSSDFVRNMRPQESQPQFRPGLPSSPSALRSHKNGSGPPSLQDDGSLRTLVGTQSAESLLNGQDYQGGRMPLGANPSIGRLRPAQTPSPGPGRDSPSRHFRQSSDGSRTPNSLRSGTPPTSHLSQEKIPERKRPPILTEIASSDRRSFEADSPDDFRTPSTTPALSIYDMPVPPKSSDRFRRDIGKPTDVQSQPLNDYFEDIRDKKPLDKDPQLPDPIHDGLMAEGTGEKATPTVSIPATPAYLDSPIISPIEEEVHRPGLGPMIKKKSNKDIAKTFRKAATAYNAFKPRSGGVAERTKGETMKSPNLPDGINGVFNAPSLLRGISQDDYEGARTPIEQSTPQDQVPEVKVTESPAPVETLAPPSTPSARQQLSPSTDQSRNTTSTPLNKQEERRRKPRSDQSAKYAKALGINPSLVEGRTFEIESVFSDVGWGEEDRQPKSYDELQIYIRKDLARVETGSWLSTFEHNDDRIATVGKMLDRAIAECDELDGLLTLYNVELGTLSEDVAYIEAQSQGLQVQTANQKLLHTELQNLLETISISASQLRVLRDASLTKPKGIQEAESTLGHLYKAMLTIDPGLRTNADTLDSIAQSTAERDSITGSLGSEISTMRAVQDKKALYRNESVGFLQRFKQYMSVKFREAETETVDAIERSRTSSSLKTSSKIDFRLREKARGALWPYSPLMLFAREIDSFEWEELMRMYETSAKKPYHEEFSENISIWKRTARKATGDEQDLLFTTHEKETESIVSRKLTVKRTKTIRSDGMNRISSGERSRDGKIDAHEAFAGALNDMGQSVFLEQNFVVDLFHVSSLDNIEFPDAVNVLLPEARKGSSLLEKKLFDPDRKMAKRLINTMDDIYSSWPAELQNLVDWAVKQDVLQSVGVLYALEQKLFELEETNQEYLTQTLSRIHGRLTTHLARFVDDQIRGIEETKVKIKKRKGVIAFMKIFPNFSAAIESMLSSPHSREQPDIRHTINDVYTKINKAMFESLNFIAKESPTAISTQAGPAQTTGDPEDKEALNYHILLIENMNHYLEEVDVRGNPVLKEWKDRAAREMAEHLDLYLNAVMRRPLGKLLDFIESTESLLNSATDSIAIATRASHSRSTFKKVLSTYDAKEIKRGIETLKKRIEKHFGDADDPGLSRALVQKVLRQCEDAYQNVLERTGRIVKDVYEGGLDVEWRKEDIVMAFRR